jgi:hypothetical protein
MIQGGAEKSKDTNIEAINAPAVPQSFAYGGVSGQQFGGFSCVAQGIYQVPASSLIEFLSPFHIKRLWSNCLAVLPAPTLACEMPGCQIAVGL